MPAYARREIVDESQAGVYHCTSRCVRRAFLCGDDALSGKNFDHRKQWVRERLELLAGFFAVDLLGFAVMSNHLHVLLRTRPDLAGQLSDEEVARRWRKLSFKHLRADALPAEEEEQAISILVADHNALAERRRRLSNISWFMRALCEPIARGANKEDGVTGRFWEGRFKSQAVLDQAGVLACSIYVDLNSIRAGVADRPETSQFTGAFERIAARQEAAAEQATTEQASAEQAQETLTEPSPGETPAAVAASPCAASAPASLPRRDDWLSPIPDGDACAASERRHSTRRASDRGFLPLSLDDYLVLLDWTGRQLRSDKRGAIPAHLQPILERLAINAEGWVESMLHFGRRFKRVIGRAASMAAHARQRGRRWYQGQAASRLAFT